MVTWEGYYGISLIYQDTILIIQKFPTWRYLNVQMKVREPSWTFRRMNVHARSWTFKIIRNRSRTFTNEREWTFKIIREWLWTFIRERSWTITNDYEWFWTFMNVHEWTEGSRRFMNNLHEQERRELLNDQNCKSNKIFLRNFIEILSKISWDITKKG